MESGRFPSWSSLSSHVLEPETSVIAGVWLLVMTNLFLLWYR